MAKARRKSIGAHANLPPSSAKIRKILDLLDEIEELVPTLDGSSIYPLSRGFEYAESEFSR